MAGSRSGSVVWPAGVGRLLKKQEGKGLFNIHQITFSERLHPSKLRMKTC